MSDGGPAFPVIVPQELGSNFDPGMTLRDFFASQAMVGLLLMCAQEWREAAASGEFSDDLTHPGYVARLAYYHADAMLAEREKASTH